MDNATVIERLQAEFGDKIGELGACAVAKPPSTSRVSRLSPWREFLRDDSALAYNFLENLCGVDYLGRQPRFEVVYHLLSHANRHRICLKVGISEKDIHVPTLTGLWQTANYQEREAYDMFGIIF
jgi:NADH-quinone oxidoreductase subunit C